MQIIFTANDSLLSRLIRWAFNEPVSHVGFVFDDERWLVHSNLLGVNIKVYRKWKKKQRIIYEIPYEIESTTEEDLFQSIIFKVDDDEYDWPGFFYFAWRGFLLKFFQKPLPRKNAWGRADMYLCTEMALSLPKWITGLSENIDLGVVTPFKLYQMLSEAKRNAVRDN